MPNAKLLVLCAVLGGCDGPDYTGGAVLRGGYSRRSAADDDGATASSGLSSPKAKTACASSKTAESCVDCCSAKAPDALPIYANAIGACLCEQPGTCAKACATTLCAGGDADDACLACVQQSGCDRAAGTACKADATCAPLIECVDASGCAAK